MKLIYSGAINSVKNSEKIQIKMKNHLWATALRE